MPVIFMGNKESAQEILLKIKQWDDAVAKLDLMTIINLCEKDVSIFDLSRQVKGTEELKSLWHYYKLNFSKNIRVYRTHITIFANTHLAFMHCYAKVDHAEPHHLLNLPWCRTTLCFQKRHDIWKIVHQHISIPQQW